jgi:4-oxalocrotonate tautomerase
VPIITASGPHLDVEQERKLAEKLTDAACAVYDRPRDSIIVIIRENDPENVAVGGELVRDRQASAK